MKHLISLLLLLMVLVHPGLAQDKGDAILGQWLTGSGKAHIEIYKENGRYWGKIVWLKNPLNDQGKPKVDWHNPEKSLQDRPLMGLINLNNFVYQGDNEYENGKIYDPESGKTYSCIMTLRNKDKLDVRGYVGISLIGRTDSWTRVK